MRLVELKKIDEDNLDDVLSLAVSDDQTAFVSTVAQSLAQAWVYRDTAFPFAIYADGAPVGFVETGLIENNMREMRYDIKTVG